MTVHMTFADSNSYNDMGDLQAFKKVFCDENPKIIAALNLKFKPFLVEPILDVGAGLGDIARAVFPEYETTLIDIRPVPGPINPNHRSLQMDFFDYAPTGKSRPNTLIFSHVLQYLDSDKEHLRSKVKAFNASTLIDVTNDNTGVFGELVKWALDNCGHANPEIAIRYYDKDVYNEALTHRFEAHLSCPNYQILAHHVTRYLLDIKTDAEPGFVNQVEEYLRSRTDTPHLNIWQTIHCYTKK